MPAVAPCLSQLIPNWPVSVQYGLCPENTRYKVLMNAHDRAAKEQPGSAAHVQATQSLSRYREQIGKQLGKQGAGSSASDINWTADGQAEWWVHSVEVSAAGCA